MASAVEKAEQTCLDGWCRVVVGSVQSLQRPARLEQFLPTILVPSSSTRHTTRSQTDTSAYWSIFRANVLGVTAAPDRGDMRNLGEVFDSLAYEYKLTQAIREGVPVPDPGPNHSAAAGHQPGRAQRRRFRSGLGTALDPYLEQIAAEMQTACAGRKTVVFLPLIKTGRKFRDILNSKGVSCGRGETGRARTGQKFCPIFQTANTMSVQQHAADRGWDCPSVDLHRSAAPHQSAQPVAPDGWARHACLRTGKRICFCLIFVAHGTP